MTGRISAVLAAILMTISLCSCGAEKSEHSVYTDIFEIYNSLETYTAEGTMTVVSNLTDNSYAFKQYYAAPDKYRIDFDGMSYICAGGNVYMKSGGGAQTLENYISGDKNYIFVTDFFNEYFKSEDASVTVSGAENGFTVLDAPSGGGNIYRAEQSMWVDNKTYLPIKIETRDANKKPVLTVEFSDFKLNEKIDESVFQTNE